MALLVKLTKQNVTSLKQQWLNWLDTNF